MLTLYALGVIIVILILSLLHRLDPGNETSKKAREENVTTVVLMAAGSWLSFLIIILYELAQLVKRA